MSVGGVRRGARRSARAAAERAAADGVHALGFGEMGIGNTTAAAAILSALTGQSSAVTVGRGTGVDGNAYARKRVVVDRAVRLHLGAVDGLGRGEELLRRLGGLELAAMAGATREAARTASRSSPTDSSRPSRCSAP